VDAAERAELREHAAVVRTEAQERTAEHRAAWSSVQETLARLSQLSAELAEAREQIANLEQALQTSRSIGMAVGIVMASRGLSSDDAFGVLRTASQHQHRKLREIAAEVVISGEVPAA
jgi:AmiR/NasT family two-component response regulator